MNKKRSYRLKEQLYKRLFLLQDQMKRAVSATARLCDAVLLISGLLFMGMLIVYFGFHPSAHALKQTSEWLKWLFPLVFIAKYVQEFIRFKSKRRWAQFVEAGLFVINSTLLVLYSKGIPIFGVHPTSIAAVAVILLFLSESSKLFRIVNSVKMAPPLLFALSFLAVIGVGSGLLMLPNAQAVPLSYFEALFTATSAVCVTGLVVVDTAVAFTHMGQLIIMLLIQIGGLGVMAFTGFFAFAFTGTVSFKDRILMRDVFSSDTLNDIFKILFKMIAFTFILEAAGALIIYFGLPDDLPNKTFTAVFHAVSAFCNAGFSTLSNGLAAPDGAYSTSLYLTISMLVVLGGIGFPVLLTFYALIKHQILKIIQPKILHFRSARYMSKNIAERLVLVTTLVLLVGGTLGYYLLERNSSLAQEPENRRWLIAFFGSMSSRTAGFNMIDMAAWSYPTIFLMIGLMWVGASPGSTGGGIKTTTIALAAHAVYNFIRGRHIVEIGYRRIGRETLSRVLVVISLSIATISTAFFMLLITEPGADPMQLLFEVVSAFSTVGLSITGTASFSMSGQTIIMVLMFVGRVGPLTLLSGLFMSSHRRYYQYPEHDLIIN